MNLVLLAGKISITKAVTAATRTKIKNRRSTIMIMMELYDNKLRPTKIITLTPQNNQVKICVPKEAWKKWPHLKTFNIQIKVDHRLNRLYFRESTPENPASMPYDNNVSYYETSMRATNTQTAPQMQLLIPVKYMLIDPPPKAKFVDAYEPGKPIEFILDLQET
jgi:pectin methylesterase-like acyl-CoA thioesterase